MTRISSLVVGVALALALAHGAHAEGTPPTAPAKEPERVTEPCGEGGPELTPAELAEKERQKHTARVAKLDRLEQVAKDSSNQALLASVARMRDKENARHERLLTRIEAMLAQREVKAEKREERRDAREERPAERADKKAQGKKNKDQAPSR